MRGRKLTANNYVHIQTKKEDKYEGLFSRKQLSDLDGGISDIEVKKVSKKELDRMRKESRSRGVGLNMHSPYDKFMV